MKMKMKGTDDDGVRLIVCVCFVGPVQCSLLNWEKQVQVHSKHSFTVLQQASSFSQLNFFCKFQLLFFPSLIFFLPSFLPFSLLSCLFGPLSCPTDSMTDSLTH